MEQDERFSHIATDPKFRRIPKKEKKVKIDKRFKSMFKDKKFKVKYTVDKRGRPVNHSTNEDLKRYYDLSSEDEHGSSDEETEDKKLTIKDTEDSSQISNEQIVGKFVRPPKSIDSDSLISKDASDQSVSKKVKKKLKNLNIDYARGEGILVSESSSDDDTASEEESESESVDHGWGELDKDAVKTDDITRRLAVCNMDWDRIRATDLMVLLNSFIPAGGIIESVTIYPSEFGKERMKEEELTGPIELVECKAEDVEENEEGSKYHMEKLRRYQLNRLKYYYAVVVADSPATANHIYEECDGLEYESSATKIDLRFIPDDTTFEDEPKESCTNLPEKYEPRFFTTTALQQAKVQLTWDENNVERTELNERIRTGNIDDISEKDLQNYLASSSGEDSDEEEKQINASHSDEDSNVNPIDKYKLLLQEIEDEEEAKKNKDIGLEISWGIDLKEKTDKLAKKKQSDAVNKTPFEEFLEKRKDKKKQKRDEKQKLRNSNRETETDEEEYSDDIPSDVDMNDPYFAEEFQNSEFKKKKKKKTERRKTNKDEDDDDDEQADHSKAELELLLMTENEDNRKHFNLKNIQESEDASKSKKKRFKKKKNNNKTDKKDSQAEEFSVDVTDDRFSALYSSHHFNIDPTDPHYKKTKGMEALIEEKLKRRTEDVADEANEPKKPRTENARSKAELSVLVKSIKRKTEAMNKKKV